MTVVISGTTGITNDGGYTGDGVVFADTTPANTLVTTNSGNVGIGTIPNTSWFSGTAAIQQGLGAVYNNNSLGAYDVTYNSVRSASDSYVYAATGLNATRFQQRDGSFRFFTAASGTAGNAISFTQAMTLGAAGDLIIGTTTRAQTAKLTIQAVAGSSKFGVGPLDTSPTNFFVVNASGTGVYLADGATSWTANSDERLKDIIEPINDAVAKVVTLRAVIGKYKTDEEGTRRAFLIAQDVLAVLPEAVNTQADEMGTLGVQYTDTIPLLVAAIQEQQAIITAQAAQIQQLREKVLEVEEGTSNMLVENTNNLYETITALTARVAALEGTQP